MAYSFSNTAATGSHKDTTGNAKVDGYSGYQIGGSDEGYASVTFIFPYDCSSYDDCTLKAVFYSQDASSTWNTNWGCLFEIWINGAGFCRLRLGRSDITTISTDAKSRLFEISWSMIESFGYNIPVFKPGDKIEFKFDGDAELMSSETGNNYSLFTRSTRCLYLCYASLVAATTPTKKYLKIGAFSVASVSASTVGTYYVTSSDYKKHWGYSWESGNYVSVVLDGTGTGYYSDITYYTPSIQYLTDSSGNRLYVVE